jgi:hypothetical protein
MDTERRSVFVGARRAADIVRDLLNVVREVNEWRREHDDYVASHFEGVPRARKHGRRPQGKERRPNA